MAKDGCVEIVQDMPMFALTTSEGKHLFPWHHVLMVEFRHNTEQLFRTIEIRTAYAKVTINGEYLDRLLPHFQDQDLYALTRGNSSSFTVDNINMEITLDL